MRNVSVLGCLDREGCTRGVVKLFHQQELLRKKTWEQCVDEGVGGVICWWAAGGLEIGVSETSSNGHGAGTESKLLRAHCMAKRASILTCFSLFCQRLARSERPWLEPLVGLACALRWSLMMLPSTACVLGVEYRRMRVRLTFHARHAVCSRV